MSNIVDSLNDRAFIFNRNNEPTPSQVELINLILKKHEEEHPNLIKFIDDNDNYDSFLAETSNNHGLCIKVSFDKIPIYYDILILSGIQEYNIAPIPIHRGQIDLDKTVYYTIQTFEYSDNLKSLGTSILMDNKYEDFFEKLKKLHSTYIPDHIPEHLDDIKSYLEYHKFNFNEILGYVEDFERYDFNMAKEIYNKIFDEMMEYVEKNLFKINSKLLVHGNLDSSTIICNNYNFKFINFENAFLGNLFFDIVNIVFELECTGIEEYNFVTNYIEKYFLNLDKYNCEGELRKYQICKKIWIYKKFLDLIKDYLKEVIVLNGKRKDKVIFLASEFSKHFYKFDSNLVIFPQYKDFFVEKLTLLLDNI